MARPVQFVSVEILTGNAGLVVGLGGIRIAGQKPSDVYRVLASWRVPVREIREALSIARARSSRSPRRSR